MSAGCESSAAAFAGGRGCNQDGAGVGGEHHALAHRRRTDDDDHDDEVEDKELGKSITFFSGNPSR